MRIKIMITFLIIGSSLSGATQVESFDSLGTLVSDSLFPTKNWPPTTSSFERDVLPSGGGPSNSLLPVSVNSDKVLFFNHTGPSISFVNNFTSDTYADLIIDGYIGFGNNSNFGSLHGGFHLRAGTNQDAYDISIISNDRQNAVFAARVQREGLIGAGFPGVTSELFPIDLENENYRIRSFCYR